MRALVVDAGVPHSARIEDVEPPRIDGVRVRVLEVGVCGTDREIVEGAFGIPPEGGRRLVLGHELLGVVESEGHGFARGDLVSAIVRRSCGHCPACDEDSPDSCSSGDYFERGITRLHGVACEVIVEDPRQLVRLPPRLGRLGVLAEPTSICARGIRHAVAIGARHPWRLRRALVIGGGAVGTLTTLLLRQRGVEVVTASLEPANAIVEAFGARYVCSRDRPPSELGSFDLVVEAAGDAQAVADALGLVGRGGIVCVLGIDAGTRGVRLPGHVLAVDLVVQNRVLFGSVNAARTDWEAAVAALARARDEHPQALEQLIALRVPLERFDEALSLRGAKATLVLDET
jgi:threonine dehydrogenase-like Zn-dependent dehydrogenase